MKPQNVLPFLFIFITLFGFCGHNLFHNNLSDNPFTGKLSFAHPFNGDQPMDTILHIEFATRVDSLYKYLQKEPNSTWNIVFKNGFPKPDLQTGDILRVTSEDGQVKEYFLQLDKYVPGTNALLGSITWPDMPNTFRGDSARLYGWKGDTIPGFNSITMNYELIVPGAHGKIPALTFSTLDQNVTVKVNRAQSLEGSVAERTISFTVTAEDSITTNIYTVLLRNEQDTAANEPFTIRSKFYKVSKGKSLHETIMGVIMGTTVDDFYANITKGDELQTLKVLSSANGTELNESDRISMGDTLLVISADASYITKYLIEVTIEVISPSTSLTSDKYTVTVNGFTGTITGFPKNTPLKTVLAGVAIPAGTTLTVVDNNDAYKPLIQLNLDTVYVDAIATSEVYFEVVAENRINKVLYQLMPLSYSSDAYVTSDLYAVDQYASLLYFVRPGTSVSSLFRNVTPVRGATMKVIDKDHFIRTMGTIYKDDRLVVLSEDMSTSKVYYFSIPAYGGGPYLAYILSDHYLIDQVYRIIYTIKPGTNITTFKSKLIPAFGTTIKIIDAQGNEITRETLQIGDHLLVTSSDGTQTATYHIEFDHIIETANENVVSTISIGPNPTSGIVYVNGLTKENRIRVLGPTGIILYDLIANSSTETISLRHQPAGLYLFVVSDKSGELKTQKIVKR